MKVIFDSKLTLIDRLAQHAALTPDKVGYVFLTDGEAPHEVSFRELRIRVSQTAAALADRFEPGERILLLLPTSLDFIVAFLGCLEAGLIAVPGFPARRRRSNERLLAIHQDAAPAAIVVEAKHDAGLDEFVGPAGAPTPILTVDELARAGSALSRVSPGRRQRIAFLQYTSGSTGSPRGVAVTHANLTCNTRQMKTHFAHTPDSVVVSWLPIFHDMGLVGCVLQSLCVGFKSVLLTPVSFALQPARWLVAATTYRGTVMGGPNFAYDLCTKKITDVEKRDIDLSGLQVAFNGSEPVRLHTMEAFAAAFAECGFDRKAFFPCYGLAESTLFVAGGPVRSGIRTIESCAHSLERHDVCRVAQSSTASSRLVSCGRIAEGTRVVIVDVSRKRACRPGKIGEIWIESESVAAGYWRNQTATERVFRARLAGDSTARTYLRTGDTGIVRDGELFIVGRIKDVIVLRGRKIYPQDVESIVERTMGRVHCNYVGAIGVDGPAGETLSIVIEADRAMMQALQRSSDRTPVASLDLFQPNSPKLIVGLIREIREVISSTLDVAVQSIHFMKMGSFPRTSSGKVRRQACQSAVIHKHPDIVLSWHSTDGQLPPRKPLRPETASTEQR